MGVRRQAREAALQALFMADFMSRWEDKEVVSCLSHFQIPTNVQNYASLLASGVVLHRAEIDSKITRASQRWSLSRMARVDRSIIRLATFELSVLPDVPKSVAINEAIEIAKRFGTKDSPVFVNGVLDKVASMIDDRPPHQEEDVAA